MRCGLVAAQGGRTNSWDSSDDFTELKLIKNGSLSGSIQTNHQDSHLLLSPELIEQLRKCETHAGEIRRILETVRLKGRSGVIRI